MTFGAAGQYAADNGVTLTVKNGEVVLDDPTVTAFVVRTGGSLNLTSLKITGAAYDWSLVSNSGTLNIASDVNVDLPKANVVYTSKANAKATINGTYTVNTIVAVDSSTSAADRRNPASTVSVKGDYTTKAQALTLTNGVIVTVDGANIESDVAVARVTEAELVVNDGELVAKGNNAIIVEGTTDATKLTINGGTVISDNANTYALLLRNTKGVYKVTAGTFESGKTVKAAIGLEGAFTETKDGETHVVPALKGILTGGKYLTNIIAKVLNADQGTVVVSDELVAEGYTVKEEGNYKVVVSTKAENDKKPAAKPEEQAPNTYDAGLVYMGLALSAIGASVVSVRKLRNN